MREIPYLEDLGLPDILKRIVTRPEGGLVVIAGTRGAGITTTLYSLLDWINGNYRGHLMTFEDPIEVQIPHKLSMVSQRQQDLDYDCFRTALDQSWRHGALVVMIGRLDLPEDMIAACQTGCKGQVVLAGMEAENVTQVVQKFHRTMGSTRWLTFCDGLAAICHQRLLPDAGGDRLSIMEIFYASSEGREILEKQDWSRMARLMEQDEEWGMQTLEQGLHAAVCTGRMTRTEAVRAAENVEHLERLLDHAPGHFPQSGS